MARYSRKSQAKVKKAMHEYKRGKLKSGRSGKTVRSRTQAIAIGLSQARRKGTRSRANAPDARSSLKGGISARGC